MDDSSKTREELLLEVADLRRQLAAAAPQAPVAAPPAEPAAAQAMRACLSELKAPPVTPIKILLIEDNPGDARLVREMLAGAEADGITLEWMPSLSQGLEYLAENKIDLILLDLSLPDSRGLETFCRAYTRAPEIPLVLLTGLDDETVALSAVQKGAQDYLIKGATDGHNLLRAIRYATERKKVQEALRQARDEMELRVEARTADLVATNLQLQEETALRLQNMAELQRLLVEVQSYSEELRISSEELQISNEKLHIQAEQLRMQNEALNSQAQELESLSEELEAGRNLLHSVLEQMPAGVIIAEPSGRIILTNRLAEAIWGQTPGSLRDLKEFRKIQRYYPDGRAYLPENIPLGRALTLGETVVNEEYLLQRPGGSHLQAVHLNVCATPVRDQHGAIIAAVATFFDITARKQAQAALRQSEERYRSLVELSPDAIVVQVKGKIVFVNKAAVKLFGAATRRDLVGQPIMDRVHADYHESVQDRIRIVRSGGAVSPQEEKVLRLDGKAVEVEAVGGAIMYQGQPAMQVVFRDITERKQAREALRMANEKLRAMIEASPLAIFHLDQEGTIRGVNPAAERIFGWGTAELLDRPLPMVPEDQWEEVRTLFRRVCQGEQLTGLAMRRRRKDGAWIDVSLSLAPMYDENGQVTGIVSLAEDITARKQAEAALAQSRAEFEAIFNSISDAIIFANHQRRIVLVNPAVKVMFGYDPEELIGKSAEMLYADRPDFLATRKKYYPTGVPEKPARFEVTYRRKDGTLFSAESLASQVRDAQGNILGGVGIHRDITTRKVAEAALKESQRQTSMLAELLANSSQPFAVGYFDGRLGMVNAAFLQLLGYSQEELSRLTFEKDLTPPEWRELVHAKHEELQRTGQPVRFEKEYLRKDGTRVPVELLVNLRRDENGQPLHYYAFITDITARKQAEAALQESEARFRAVFENAAIGIALTDPAGRILALNPALEKSLGYCLPDMSGKTFTTITHADDIQPTQDLFAELMSGRRDHYRLEKRYICKNGNVLWVNLTVSLIRDAAGAPKFSVGLIEDITARKAAEAALMESEERYRSLFEMNHAVMLLIDPETGAIVDANPAACSFYGYSREELTAKKIADLNPLAPERVSNEMQKAKDGRQRRFQFRHRLAGGEVRDVEVFSGPIRIKGQNLLYSIIHDITARKEAEAALERERQRLFDLFEALPASIYLQGEDFTVRFANRRCREIFGDAKNQVCYKAFHELEAPCQGCPSPAIIATQTSQEIEKTIENGRTFQIFKYPFRDVDGSHCILSLGLDITERKQAETALKESEGRFRQLAENLDDAILLASANLRRVHYISPAYARIWGRSCDSLYQKPRSWLESVVPKDQNKVRAALKALIAADPPADPFPEFRIIRPDGAVRWILARFFPIRNEAEKVYRIAGLATDITSRKEMEAVLKWRQEHLGQTAKMEAVGRLAGGVAHDFNNLLTVISGYGELLLADLQDADQKRQQVQAILKAADQATAVTRQLLAFSRKQVLQPQILDLNGLIIGLVEMFNRLVDENIKISMILEPELGVVKADPSHMEQVVMNLAINAMDAMPQGGVLTIETANVRVTPGDARQHPEIAPGAYVVMKVTDTGVGMNRDILAHIFEPFFTTKERGQGTGLGLSMAYGIIKQSGGHILVESTPQQGSTFRIYLPRVAKIQVPAELPDSALTHVQDTGTILLVEDEPGVRHVVQRMLALKGYSVLTAHDGQEALNIAQSHPGPIHLLLTDVAMPAMGGREVAERLVQAHPEMKVLFMSGHTEDGIVRRGVRESVINFIQKPFRADQLLHSVRKLLAPPKP